eukprot:2515478-Prymnesium_polylepis.1
MAPPPGSATLLTWWQASGTPAWCSQLSSDAQRRSAVRTALVMRTSPLASRPCPRTARQGACSHCRPIGKHDTIVTVLTPPVS